MLQQTQVHRVIPKFNSFMAHFPDWSSLAKASVKDVLQQWSGLGYNRRALYLKRIAEIVVSDPEYLFLQFSNNAPAPATYYEKLIDLPGIGPNTAGSILAFAFNIPELFIETNIRSVFIHSFFAGVKKKIHDEDIFPLIGKTIDNANPREWYWALMDYGSYLKSTSVNPSRKSAHHVKQKSFKGSNRELRSKILSLVMNKSLTQARIVSELSKPPFNSSQIEMNIEALAKEGFIKKVGKGYEIA